MKYLIGSIMLGMLVFASPGRALGQVSDEVLRAVVQHELALTSHRVPGTVAVNAFAVAVRWERMNHPFPKYRAVRTGPGGAPIPFDVEGERGRNIAATVAGLGVSLRPRSASDCMFQDDCPNPLALYIELSDPLIEGDSAWVYYYVTIRLDKGSLNRDGRIGAYGSIGTMELAREGDHWHVVQSHTNVNFH